MTQHSMNPSDVGGRIGEVYDIQDEQPIIVPEDGIRAISLVDVDQSSPIEPMRHCKPRDRMQATAKSIDGGLDPYYGDISIGYSYQGGRNINRIMADRRDSAAQLPMNAFNDGKAERARAQVLYTNNVTPLALVPSPVRLSFPHQVRQGPEGFTAGIENDSGQIFPCQ